GPRAWHRRQCGSEVSWLPPRFLPRRHGGLSGPRTLPCSIERWGRRRLPTGSWLLRKDKNHNGAAFGIRLPAKAATRSFGETPCNCQPDSRASGLGREEWLEDGISDAWI